MKKLALVLSTAMVLLMSIGCGASSAPAGVLPHADVTISPIERSATPRPFRKALTITATNETYGADPLQVVTVSRDHSITAPQKTVIFLHGGGWTTGGRSSLAAEAAEWSKTGWVAINASYRLGVLDGTPDDGKNILADVLTVLTKYRAMSYVDPDKVVVYGESAGGHLADWVGSKYGPDVKAIVALSPVDSVQGAITAGEAPGAPGNVVTLGKKADEFFGYSVGTTDSHRYRDRVQHAAIAFSTNEWVDPDIHGRVFCTALGSRCHAYEFPGTAHAGTLADQQPQLLVDLRHWADVQVGS